MKGILFIFWFALRGAAFLVPSLLGACTHSPVPTPDTPEFHLRSRLGVPPDAKRVIVFAQTAHLDVDWQKTFNGYYQAFVSDIFSEARQILDQQPRAYYSVAEMAYLQHHVEQHPEELAALQRHARSGALRIVGGGVTSPDTVLPETELLLRDFLHGARTSDDLFGVRPHSAWLPDSFGHAATAPDVLAAAGFDSVAFSRIDGAPTIFEALKNKNPPPRPNSDAAMLEQLGSADFVWRGPGGGEVLAHYLTLGLYCTGDNIDYKEVFSIPGAHLGPYYGDDPGYTDGMIESYIAALRPYAKTPYSFVPVGCDFQHPKPELISYLDGYNRRQYPTTGVFAVAAPFEDYAQLVLAHKEALPALAVDLSPYFMGFYASRADVKRRTREAARPLFVAETFAPALTDGGVAIAAALRPAFTRLARSNHHDFVTGTSTDDVVATEQLPLLDAVQAAGQSAATAVASEIAARIPRPPDALARVLVFNAAGTQRTEVADVALPFALSSSSLRASAGARAVPIEMLAPRGGVPGHPSTRVRLAIEDMPPLAWRAIDLRPGNAPAPPRVSLQLLDGTGQPTSATAAVKIVLANEHVRAEWTRSAGYALTSLQLDGVEALAGASFLLHDYTDQGGLWRLGNEMPGCSLAPLPPSTSEAMGETAAVLDRTNLKVRVAFRSASAVREAWLDAGATGLQLALTTGAAMGTTRTASFSFAATTGAPRRTSLAGGFAERAFEKVYTPTYWPAVAWLSVDHFTMLLRQSTGARFGAAGDVELMAARDARSEQCDIEGGTGSDTGQHRIEWRIERQDSPAAAEQAAQRFNRPLDLELPSIDATATATDLAAEQSLAHVDGEGILSAFKPADRGSGLILRALLLPGPVTLHLGPLLAGRHLTRTDAAERDLEDLGVASDTIVLDRAHYGAIATVRLR